MSSQDNNAFLWALASLDTSGSKRVCSQVLLEVPFTDGKWERPIALNGGKLKQRWSKIWNPGLISCAAMDAPRVSRPQVWHPVTPVTSCDLRKSSQVEPSSWETLSCRASQATVVQKASCLVRGLLFLKTEVCTRKKRWTIHRDILSEMC